MSLSILSLFAVSLVNAQDGEPTSWTQVATLPAVDHHLFATYNGDSNYPECAWLFGSARNEFDMYCFNINTYELISFGTVDLLNQYYIRSYGDTASVYISNDCDDYIYFFNGIDNYLIKYDLNDRSTSVINIDLKNTFQWSCMVQNPHNNDQLIFIEGFGKGNVAIFTISTNTMQIAQSLHTPRYAPTVVVIDNEYSLSNPYLYVFQGGSTNIERLDLSSNDLLNQQWETLSTTTTLSNTNCDFIHASFPGWQNTLRWGNSFLWNNKIYLVGGMILHNNIWYNRECILTYDIVDDNVEYFGDFPVTIGAAAFTVAGTKVVAAGGCTLQSACTHNLNSIYVSNDLGIAPSTPPTQRPTQGPTQRPTQGGSSGCTNKYIGVNTNLYDWEGARDYCQSYYNTNLATITSDNDVLEALLAADNANIGGSTEIKFFIGYYYNVGFSNWMWLDGTNSDYTCDNFVIGTNEFCTLFYTDESGIQQFQTVKCSQRYNSFLCNNPDCSQ